MAVVAFLLSIAPIYIRLDRRPPITIDSKTSARNKALKSNDHKTYKPQKGKGKK